MNRNTIEAIVIGVVATGLSYLTGITAGWIHGVNIIELLAVFTSYMSTYLCVKERRLNYPLGAISSVLYAIVFFQQGLLASMMLNIYLAPALIYGWFRWRNDADARPVSRLDWRWIPVYVAVTGVAYAIAAFLADQLGGTLAITDSFILVGTILAQFLLDNKKLENWIIWAVVNVFAIYTYFNAELYLAAFQYVLFLANTVYGFYTWRKSMRNAQSVRFDDSPPSNARPLVTD